MLDQRTSELLNIINGECQGTGYKILSLSELSLSMPKKYCMDQDGIRQSLKVLYEKEYLSVKYEDQNEVCLAVLPKGRLVFENGIEKEMERKSSDKRTATFAFMGALFGGIVVALGWLILRLFFGGR